MSEKQHVQDDHNSNSQLRKKPFMIHPNTPSSVKYSHNDYPKIFPPLEDSHVNPHDDSHNIPYDVSRELCDTSPKKYNHSNIRDTSPKNNNQLDDSLKKYNQSNIRDDSPKKYDNISSSIRYDSPKKHNQSYMIDDSPKNNNQRDDSPKKYNNQRDESIKNNNISSSIRYDSPKKNNQSYMRDESSTKSSQSRLMDVELGRRYRCTSMGGEDELFEDTIILMLFFLQLFTTKLVLKFPKYNIFSDINDSKNPLGRMFNVIYQILNKITENKHNITENILLAIISPFLTVMQIYIAELKQDSVNSEKLEIYASYVEKRVYNYYEILSNITNKSKFDKSIKLMLHLTDAVYQNQKVYEIKNLEQLVDFLSEN